MQISQNLSETEKDKYKKMAGKEKAGEDSTPRPANVYGNTGYTLQVIPVELVLAKQKAKNKELQAMKESITKILTEGKGTGGESRKTY